MESSRLLLFGLLHITLSVPVGIELLVSAFMGDEGVEMFCNGTLSNRQATLNGKIMKAKFYLQ